MFRIRSLAIAFMAAAVAASIATAQPVTMPTAKTSNGQTISATPVVPLSPSGAAIVSPGTGATSTMNNATVTTGGTFQLVLSSSGSRKGCMIQNPINAIETLFVFFGGSGYTTANSVELAPGAQVSCASGGVILTDAIYVTGATTGHAFKFNSF
jgi:hypothetical protein